jgi:8-oxo-dGTP pyrophosphatase MutT (NUDIX family)
MVDHARRKVALVKKNRPDFQIGLYNGVGGRVELGESSVQAMVREAYEEAGLTSTKDDWLFFHHERHPSGKCLNFYIVDVPGLEFVVKTKTDEPIRIFDYWESGRIIADPSLLLFNVPWLFMMGISYLEHPQHRYLEG